MELLIELFGRYERTNIGINALPTGTLLAKFISMVSSKFIEHGCKSLKLMTISPAT